MLTNQNLIAATKSQIVNIYAVMSPIIKPIITRSSKTLNAKK